MPEKLQTFLVNIAIIEGRHYIWPNINSTVMVQIDKQKKCTAVKFNTDCPYYNEYFVFDFLTTLDKILDKNVVITVIKPGSMIRKRKVLGYTTFDIGTVWYQEDHQIYHKWAILTAPTKESITSTRGYLKLTVSVLSKGQLPKIPTYDQSDEIESNLFLPEGVSTQRQKVNFIFDVYRGIEFVKKNPLQEGSKRSDTPPNSYIQISFSGDSKRTELRKNTSTPVWNERLVLPEWFPPLCQRFIIDLYHDGTKKATRFLSLRTISSDKEEGFLPTFGPSFVHFYSPNNLEGYIGKVLLFLQTSLLGDLEEYETRNYLIDSEISPIREDYFLKYEDIVVFATIFDVSCISRKFGDKAISFRLSCGPSQLEESGDKYLAITPPIKPKITNKNYCYLPIENSKPCLHVTVTLPDVRKRIFNHNLILKMVTDLKSRLDKIEDIFNNKDYKIAGEDTKTLLMETLDFISSAAAKYIDIASNYNFQEGTLLDRERIKMSIKEMEKILYLVQSIPKIQSKKRVFQKIEKIYSRIEVLVEIVEDWPRIYLWMIYGNKRVAYTIIDAHSVLHSPVEEEKGVYCGTLRSVYFQSGNASSIADFITSVCKMDIMMWMGLPRHLHSHLPHGFNFSLEPIPRNLISEEIHYFQARAHIFQGRFTPGADKSGLCDPVVHVIINEQFRQSQILHKILAPLWDQTLIFQKITLYGSDEFIKNNPPNIVFEVYDKDECCKFELVGKTVIHPIIKNKTEPYSPPRFPPKLQWYKIYNKLDVSAELLTTVELLELSQELETPEEEDVLVKIPLDIKPNLVNYKLEVVFWGVRDLKKIQMCPILRPKIVVICGNVTLSSDTITNSKKLANFTNPVKSFEAHFSEQQEYAPPLRIKMYDCRNFGISALCGTHIVPVWPYLYNPITAIEREKKLSEFYQESYDYTRSIESVIKEMEGMRNKDAGRTKLKVGEKKKSKWKIKENDQKESPNWTSVFQMLSLRKTKKSPVDFEEQDWEGSDDFDWWTKFYASLEQTPSTGKLPLSHKYKLKVYPNELEKQPEFGNFSDTLMSFQMYKGKRTGDEAVDEENTTGVFKGALIIYKWPLPSDNYVTMTGLPLQNGYYQDFPVNVQVRYQLRVYCVRALNLSPKDYRGKADPYITVTLNQQIINDRENRIMGQVNPNFGRCFELAGVFPQDHTLVISVIDYDAATSDDLIGETKIDLENRFYSKHRPHCGIAQDYVTSGYCTWRDQQKPLMILENLCKKYNIGDIEFGASYVKVAGMVFMPEGFTASEDADYDHQMLALHVLKNWHQIPLIGFHLVPEHVETRSLFIPERPGIEQGKLQLWIDILPMIERPTPKQVNISPRKPDFYELRVIVWNAEDITLQEYDIFTKGQKADIFVKGWLVSPDKAQYTDVHYRSLNGEAMFNWRFIFTFHYLSSENKIIIKKKSMFGSEDKEEKVPCNLTLQTWDNDTFSSNDFLGVMNLDLSKLPKGASTGKEGKPSTPRNKTQFLNLFKIRRTKGWWPLKSVDSKTQKELYGGSLELEFELLTEAEAKKSPAGFARNDPQGLPKPKRPDTSFSFFSNPLRTLKYVWKALKKKLILGGMLIIGVVLFAYSAYTLTKYGVKGISERISGVHQST